MSLSTLRLVPLAPIGPLTPESACPHSGEYPPYPFVCMVCDRSYADGLHPALHRDPAKDPKRREAKKSAAPTPPAPKKLTRRERRAIERSRCNPTPTSPNPQA